MTNDETKERAVGFNEFVVAAALAVICGVAFEWTKPITESLKNEPGRFPLVLRIIALCVTNTLLAGAALAMLRVSGLPRFLRSYPFVCFWNAFKTEGRFFKLVGEWSVFVRKGTRSELVRIRAAIASQYIKQEVLDLGGASDYRTRTWTEERLADWVSRGNDPVESRPLIVTSFVRYAKLIEAMLEGARHARKRARKDTHVLCVTAITMPLSKWLNFDMQANAHPVWDLYLDFLKKKVIQWSDFTIARIVLVRPDGHKEGVADALEVAREAAEAEPADAAAPGLQLRTLRQLKNEMQHLVWETLHDPSSPDASASYELVAVSPADLAAKFQDVWPSGALTENVRADRYAYVILDSRNPEAMRRANEPRGGGHFRRLGEAFIERFHTISSGTRHAYYALVKPEDYRPDPDSPLPPNPTDFFYVGLVSAPTANGRALENVKQLACEGLFCLSAKNDGDLKMVNLSLLDPQRCPEIFAEVNDYVHQLLKNSVALDTLL